MSLSLYLFILGTFSQLCSNLFFFKVQFFSIILKIFHKILIIIKFYNYIITIIIIIFLNNV